MSCSSNSMSEQQDFGRDTRLQGLAPIPDYSDYTEEQQPLFLILGSFPSLSSLQAKAYYAHPRNHFWQIVGTIFETDLEEASVTQRSTFLKENRILIWDSIAACTRIGSLDSAIKDALSNDIPGLLEHFPSICTIGLNGFQSARIFCSSILPEPIPVPALGQLFTVKISTDQPHPVRVMRLPSTSPVPTRTFRTAASKIPFWKQFFTIHL